MKRVEIASYGVPEQVARCMEVPDVGTPGAGEITFEVLAFPINPTDIIFCAGGYPLRPPLPTTPGSECVGRVLAVGEAVPHIAPGDLVINLQRENWAQRRRDKGEDVVPLPTGIAPLQAAMMRINPPTALLMLTDLVALQPGDWVIQNAANSAVGKLVIHFAHTRGLHTVNVVRREALSAELEPLGADVCIVDGPDLAARVRSIVGRAPIRFGLDAVAGDATGRLAASVADGGTVCGYGVLSGKDVVVGYPDFIFRSVNVVGFMLGRFLAKRSPSEVQALYEDIAAQVRDGSLQASVEAVYPIDEIGAALAHAQRSARGGKILVTPNGTI